MALALVGLRISASVWGLVTPGQAPPTPERHPCYHRQGTSYPNPARSSSNLPACVRVSPSPLFLFAVPWLSTAAWAQLAPDPDAPPVSNAPAQPDSDQSVATFKLNTNLVDLFFTVKDKNGNLVPHLTQSDCAVQEDKVPQKLKSFTAETDLPLTLGILLDTSGSQQRVLPLEQDAASQFLQRVMRSKDEAFAVNFDVNVDLLQDFTNSPRLLAHALEKAQINTRRRRRHSRPGRRTGPGQRSQGNAALRRHLPGRQRKAEPGNRPQGHHHPHRRRG